jgi:hypothetical protein
MKNKIENIQSDVKDLFKKWWNEDVITKENKISFKSGLEVIRIPYMSLMILNTGDFISSKQFDDILDAINESNKTYEEVIKEIRCKTTVDYTNAQVLTDKGLRPITKEEIDSLNKEE